MEVTEPLRWEHEVVLDRLKAFEKALDEGDWKGIRETLRFFDERLVLHRRKEEEILFPALGRHIGTEHGPIHCMLEEHRDEKEKVERVRSAVARGDLAGARSAGGYILGLLRNHIAKENQILYPMVEDILSAEEKGGVEERMNAIGYCWKDGDLKEPLCAGRMGSSQEGPGGGQRCGCPH